MIPIAFMLALQAGGMVVDYLGKSEQIRLGKMGAKLEQEGIESNIQTSRLEAEQSSLEAMKQLRQNLGSQAAMMAARGIRSGSGNAVLFANESVGNFNANERIRNINQKGREAGLKAGKLLSTLHQKTFENNTWNEFRKSIVDKVGTSTFDAFGGGGASSFSGSKATSSGSYGLTKVRS